MSAATTKNATKHLAAVYRKAARSLEKGPNKCDSKGCRASCCAIAFAAPKDDDARLRYKAVFLHDAYAEENGWWNSEIYGDEHLGTRILALCFMAAMVEAGDA